jgi:type IV secretory pathway VirB4 component
LISLSLSHYATMSVTYIILHIDILCVEQELNCLKEDEKVAKREINEQQIYAKCVMRVCENNNFHSFPQNMRFIIIITVMTLFSLSNKICVYMDMSG